VLARGNSQELGGLPFLSKLGPRENAVRADKRFPPTGLGARICDTACVCVVPVSLAACPGAGRG
jgi:hypothetical protein